MLDEGLMEGTHLPQGQMLVEEAGNLQAFRPGFALCRCHLWLFFTAMKHVTAAHFSILPLISHCVLSVKDI